MFNEYIGLATIKPINLWRCASVINGIYDIYIDNIEISQLDTMGDGFEMVGIAPLKIGFTIMAT